MDVEPLSELLQRVEALASITSQLAKMVEARQAEANTNANHATITINAGGWATIIMAGCCFFLLGLSIGFAFWMAGENQRARDEMSELRSTDNAIRAYITTGYLKPLPKDEPKRK